MRLFTAGVSFVVLLLAAFGIGRWSSSRSASASPEHYARLVKMIVLKAGTDCRSKSRYVFAAPVIGRVKLPHRPVSIDYAWSPTAYANWNYSGVEGNRPIYFWETSEGLHSNRPVNRVTRLTVSFQWTGTHLLVQCLSNQRLELGFRIQYDVVYRSP